MLSINLALIASLSIIVADHLTRTPIYPNNIWDKTSRPIYSHLIWVCIAIGLHSFSLYCHNDTLEALGRPEDIFHDNSIQLKAIFAKQSFLRAELQPDIEMLDKRLYV